MARKKSNASATAQIDTEKVKAKIFAKSELPTHLEFMEEIFRLGGGVKNVARLIWQEFTAENASPLIKAKMSEMILRHLKTIADASDPLALVEGMSEEELNKLIDERVRELGAVGTEGADV